MNTDAIIRLLTNAGFHDVRADAVYIYFEDPGCVLRSFETFVGYAWVIIAFITGVLLFGWAIAYIRGSKVGDIFINIRNLVLIFGTLTAAGTIVDFMYGDKLFSAGCDEVKVMRGDVQKIIDARDARMKSRADYDLYEDFDIYDSGAIASAVASLDLPTATDDDIVVESASVTATTSVTASAVDGGVKYVRPDGSEYKKIGGSIAWRNNNPGNLRMTEFTRKNGAIGAAGGFAIFPDRQTGAGALRVLFQSNSYRGLTINGAIARYAPAFENNTAAYQRNVIDAIGVPADTIVGNLDDAQMNKMIGAMMRIEGWQVGRETDV